MEIKAELVVIGATGLNLVELAVGYAEIEGVVEELAATTVALVTAEVEVAAEDEEAATAMVELAAAVEELALGAVVVLLPVSMVML